MNYFNHLKTVLTHKKWVNKYCKMAGIPWRGIKHDLSKFSNIEFKESCKYWTGNRSPIDNCKDENGYSKAWQHHKGRNTHHWEYWIDNIGDGHPNAILMPYEDCVEMICDFLGAARAYMGSNFTYTKEYEWWLEKRKHVLMHPVVKEFVDVVFIFLKKYHTNPKAIINEEFLSGTYKQLVQQYRTEHPHDWQKGPSL